MRGVKRVVLVLIILVVALVVLAFVLENQQGAVLSFFGWTTPQAPISIFVALSLLIGMVVGPLIGLVLKSSRHSRPRKLAP